MAVALAAPMTSFAFQAASVVAPARAAGETVTRGAAHLPGIDAKKRANAHHAGPPTGSIYHAPHGTPYHIENSRSGIVRADRLGYDQIDLDLHMTRDGVVVATHWHAPMRRDGFYDTRHRLARHRTVASMTWAQVSRLRTHDGYRIFALRQLIPMLGERHVIGSLEPKGDHRFARPGVMTTIAAWCEATRARAYVKSIPKFDRRGRIRAAARAAGFWTRNAGVSHQNWRPPKR